MIQRKLATAAFASVSALVLVACGAAEEEPKVAKTPDKAAASSPAAKAPDYKIILQERVSGAPHIDVEVSTTENLQAVFEEVANKSKEGGQHQIRIACSTGGTEDMLNLLAYGSYTPGLWNGDIQLPKGSATFTEEDGKSCPAK
ncbi:hypothetical protein [Streptomyces griseoflavus]|uniref:hypothetical protein n=1 Tax=Streptomyces griseoflavus TaxID=35619 RepID=UPI003D719965